MKTFVDGEVLTAADLNSNFAALGTRIQKGKSSVTTIAGTNSTAVTFPEAFAGTPTVLLTAETSNPGGNQVGVVNAAATGFSIRTTATSAGTIAVHWLAIY
jgi:hypothetical protein